MSKRASDKVTKIRIFELHFPGEDQAIFVYFSRFSQSYGEAKKWGQEKESVLNAIHIAISPHNPRSVRIRVREDDEILPDHAVVTHLENPGQMSAQDFFDLDYFKKDLDPVKTTTKTQQAGE